MWERFSYYGMRGLLIFYLTQHFLFDDKAANGQYGSYATLVYLLPLVGGVLADRYLGARKAVAFGALLLVAGHLTMAVEGPAGAAGPGLARPAAIPSRSPAAATPASPDVVAGRRLRLRPADQPATSDQGPAGGRRRLPTVLPKGSSALPRGRHAADLRQDVLYLALALIIMGVGFLKANISTIVGQLYGEGDPRRDPGFTLYYYGVNLGAFWAAILCGYLGQTYGWKWGFGLAGVGMLAGYVTFMLGKPSAAGQGRAARSGAAGQAPRRPAQSRMADLSGAAIAGLAVVWLLVQHNSSGRRRRSASAGLALWPTSAWFMARSAARSSASGCCSPSC